MLSQANTHWFANTLLECTILEGRTDYYRAYHDGNKVLVAYRSSNAFWRYFGVNRSIVLKLETVWGRDKKYE